MITSFRKFVFTGPESSGKTTLTKAIAGIVPTSRMVPEYSRFYLTLLDRPYCAKDLVSIGKGQVALENISRSCTITHLFCDTSLLVIKIWSEYKYQRIDPWIEQQFIKRHYDMFFLCQPDIPWERDPLREHPDDRWELYEKYKETLFNYEKPFVEVGGSEERRLFMVRNSLQRFH